MEWKQSFKSFPLQITFFKLKYKATESLSDLGLACTTCVFCTSAASAQTEWRRWSLYSAFWKL